MSCPDTSQPRRQYIPQFWELPDGPDRPPFPYITGFTTQIRRHAPLPPFGQPDYGPTPRPRLSPQYMKSVPQSVLVVDNPPLETPPSQANPDTSQLIINAPISVGTASGAQVVTCSVTPQTGEPFQAAAKIYDALYYRFSVSLAPDSRDVVIQSDQDYSREAAAYEYLQGTGQTGSFAPPTTARGPSTSPSPAGARPRRGPSAWS